jgi:hypothetical protein
MIQAGHRRARLLATLDMHCATCDTTGPHALLEFPAPAPRSWKRLAGRRSWELACAGCGAVQYLTSEQKDHALKYISSGSR